MVLVALGLFGLGLIFGSFVNAFVWRLHEQAELAGKKGKAADRRRRELSMLHGRSMCPSCGHELAAKDLVPVFSWLALKGKCRYCATPISGQYPAVELATAILFALSYVSWPYGLHGAGLLQFVVWLVFVVGFVALAVYDLRWLLLPDRIVLPLIGLAAAETVVLAVMRHDYALLWRAALGAVIIFGLFWILFQVSKGGWIGGGDVKLGAVLGVLAASPLRAFMVIFFASLLGTLASIPLLVRGRSGLKMHIPFGPFLLAGMVIVVLYGPHIVLWYDRLLLA